MKKNFYSILIILCFILLLGCSKKNEKSYESSNKDQSAYEQSSENKQESKQKAEDDSKDKPNGKISPEISGETIDTFETFDQLDEQNKSKVIYDYLLQATLAIGNGESGAKELLKEKGYDSQNANELLPELEELRKKNPNDDFNQLMILLVQFVMEGK